MDGFDPSWCARINAARRAADAEAAASSGHGATVPAASVPSAGDAVAAVEKPRSRGTPFREVRPPSVHDCECCGSVMYDHSCKIVCPNCGYKRDCSDP